MEEKKTVEEEIKEAVETSQPEVQAEAVEEEVSQYEPNYSYSVKGVQHEIPEYLRAAIVDEDSESQVRDIMTKLDGFDGIKQGRDEAIEKAGKAEEKTIILDQYFSYLDNMIKSKDYDNFFLKEAQLSEDEIINYAEQLLQRREMPLHEQQRISQQNDIRMQNYQLSQQNQSLAQAQSSLDDKMADIEIQNTFSNPDVIAAERELDERLGKPGSFKQVVAEIGGAVYGTKNEISVLDAANEAIKRFGLNQRNEKPAAPKQVVNPKVQQKVVVDNTAMPVVGSGASSQTVVERELTPEDLDRLEAEALGGKLGR